MLEPIVGLHHVTAIASDPQRNLDFYTEVPRPAFRQAHHQLRRPRHLPLLLRRRRRQPRDHPDLLPVATCPSRTHRRRRSHAHRLQHSTRLGRLLGAAPARQGHPRRAHRSALQWRRRGFSASNPSRLTAAARASSRLQAVFARQPHRRRYGRPGAGSVHHIAYRAKDDAAQLAWLEEIGKHLQVTPVQDRTYFHSIYFREPGGVLFELATDPPGFGLDEPAETLGEALRIPAWFEPHRAEIEARLVPIELHRSSQAAKKEVTA